ncbi:hypothetical protein LJC26_07345 [Desulfovibrio sp. OttesenSCG-928-O18]|nr:hypothetical protein [Desulfovibrio sp. OttesenSCG-928-O18]
MPIQQPIILQRSGSVVAVPMPDAAQVLVAAVQAGDRVALGFGLSSVLLFDRFGDSLALTLENNGVVRLEDFFAVGDAPLPVLELPGGAEVPLATLLKAGLDVTPGANGGSGEIAPQRELQGLVADTGALSLLIDKAKLQNAPLEFSTGTASFEAVFNSDGEVLITTHNPVSGRAVRSYEMQELVEAAAASGASVDGEMAKAVLGQLMMGKIERGGR